MTAKCAFLICATLALSLPAAGAQAPSSNPSPSASKMVQLNVEVNNQSGEPVTDLTEADVKVLDNKSTRPITSFKLVHGTEEPVHVILVLDSVDLPYTRIASIRGGMDRFLMANNGKVPYPTTIAYLSDKGLQIRPGFSTDGTVLSAGLAHIKVDVREITQDTEWGRSVRIQYSLRALEELLGYSATLPGRKIVIWVSPGWPLLSGPQMFLSSSEEESIFSNAILFCNRLREDEVTLYNINPVGVGAPVTWEDYYQSFLNGLTKAHGAQMGNLALPVLALHSGGEVFESNGAVARYIEKCLMDAQSWYEIAFEPPPGKSANQYHHVAIEVARPGLTARTTDQYYANPKLVVAKR